MTTDFSCANLRQDERQNFGGYYSNLIEIAKDAFANNDIGSINLPNSLVYIKDMSFFNNKISGELNLSLNDNLKYIGDNAFKNNSIESIILPINVETIENDAFIKNNESNINLSKVINLSQKEFDWNNIIGKIDDITFSFKLDSEIEKKS